MIRSCWLPAIIVLLLGIHSSIGQTADQWVRVSSEDNDTRRVLVLNDTLYKVNQAGKEILISRFDNGIWKKMRPLRVAGSEVFQSLAIFQGRVYVATNVALYRYSGSQWDHLYSENFQRLIVYNGRLILQGGFTSINGVFAYGFATYDGVSLDVLRTQSGQIAGLTGQIIDMKVIGGKLYAGGPIANSQQSTILSDLAVWNDTNWVDGFISPIVNPGVWRIFSYNGKACLFTGIGMVELNGMLPSRIDSLGSSLMNKNFSHLSTPVEYNSKLWSVIEIQIPNSPYTRTSIAQYDGIKWEETNDSLTFQQLQATSSSLFADHTIGIWWPQLPLRAIWQYDPNAQAVGLAIADAPATCDVDSARLFFGAPVRLLPSGTSYFSNRSGPQTIYLPSSQASSLYYPSASLRYYQSKACSDTIQALQLGSSGFQEAYFYVEPIQASFDVKANIIGSTGWRCRQGFRQDYYLVIENVGTEPLYNVLVDFDFPIQSAFDNASHLPISNQSGNVSFLLDSVLLGGQEVIRVKLHNTLSLTIGDTVPFRVRASISQIDQDTTNNFDELRQVVTAAYDPNDKHVKPSAHHGWGGRMEYLINFQNLGTDTAYKVVVVDTLPAQVKPSTFRFIGSRHPVDIQMNDRYLVFEFDNILLPDSAIDPDGSKGFVMFSIEMDDQLGPTDTIENRAFIYFDFQPAVITNWAYTYYVSGIDLIAHENSSYIIAPNPTTGLITIRAEANGIDAIEVYNMVGLKVSIEQQWTMDKVNIHLPGPSGLYIIKIRSTDGTVSTAKIIKE